jgi:hypothetical protein
MQNVIQVHNLDTVQLSELIGNIFDTKIKDLFQTQTAKSENDDLMTRAELLALLKINPSTLFHWQNKGKITAYKFANKCYYKRSEIMATITPLNK